MVYHGLRNMRIPISIPVCLLLFAGASSGANDKALGKELLEKARKASDIRSEGAAAFRMEGSFRIVTKASAQEIKGRYTEIWVSKTKWRREVETTSFHRIEVGGPTRKWFLDSGTDRPEAVFDDALTLLFPTTTPDVGHASEPQLEGVKANCVKSKTKWSKQIDCVDPETGVFLLRETLNSVHQTCTYRDYERFGERLFPRSVRCITRPGDEIELTITKLAAETPLEESLFAKPQGGIETANCFGAVTAPQATYSPDPSYPNHHNESLTVRLWMIIGVDGKPQDVRVARSGGKDFDLSAIDSVRQWKFKPSMCDGAPVPVRINLEVSFRRY
jgi:TonB family protein